MEGKYSGGLNFRLISVRGTEMRVSCRVILNNSYLSLLAGVQAFVLSETVIYIRIFLIKSVLNIVYIYIYIRNEKKKGKLSSRIKSYPLKIRLLCIILEWISIVYRCLFEDRLKLGEDTGSRNRWISTRSQPV